MEELPVREAVSASRRRRGGGIWDSETNKSNVANLQLDRSLSQIDESLLVAEGSEVPAVAQFRRSYSSLLADEAGMPIDIMKAALEEAGRDEAAKPQVLSTAQRIWNSRGEPAAYQFKRTYSNLLADEAEVPIEVMKQALEEEGRDEAAKPQVLSTAQRIWNSRRAHSTAKFERTYSVELADEAGVPIDIMKEALEEVGRDEAAKPQVMSAAQRIWRDRRGSPATNAFNRTCSTLLADEADVPIDIMREALQEQGRDESARPQVMSAAQRILDTRIEEWMPTCQ